MILSSFSLKHIDIIPSLVYCVYGDEYYELYDSKRSQYKMGYKY